MATHKREVEIQNEAGMHLRPAAAFVQTANKHKDCEVQVSNSGQRVNGKSIMGLVMLAAGKGTVLTIECNGDEAEQALEDLCKLVAANFNATEE